jgi:hypothetical protein
VKTVILTAVVFVVGKISKSMWKGWRRAMWMKRRGKGVVSVRPMSRVRW